MNEEKYKKILETAPFGYAYHKIIVDDNENPIDYIFLEVNEFFENITGLKKENIIGEKVTKILKGLEYSQFDWISFYGKVALNGGKKTFEQYNKDFNKWFSVQVHSPEKYYFSTVFTDITEIKNKSIELEESKTKWQIYVENAPYAVFIADKSGKYLDVNPMACKITEYTKDELLNMSIPDLLIPSSFESAEKHFEKLLKEGYSYGEMIYKTKTGKLAWWSVLAQKISENKYIGYCEDITTRKLTEEKLNNNDLLLKKLSQQVPGVIYQYQYFPDGRNCFPFATEHIWDIYEVTPEEVKESAVKVLSRLHPEDYDSVIAKIVYSFESLEIWEDEYRVILPQKGLRWLHGIAKPEKLEDESVIWHGYIYDITEKKETEQALSKSEEKHRFLFENMTQGVIYHNKSGEITYANNSAAEILGLTINQLYGKTSMDPNWKTIHEDGSDYSGETHPAVITLKTGKIIKNAVMGVYNPQKNIYKWININSIPKFGCNFETEEVIVTLEDITEQKKAQKELEKSEQEYKTTVDSLLVGVIVHDANTQILISNTEASNIFGLTPEQLTGKEAIDSFWKFVNEDLTPMKFEDYPINKVISTKSPLINYILGIIRPDRYYVTWVLVNAMPLFFTDGKLEKVIINFIDISEQKRAEEEILKAKKEAESANKAKSEFLANMSHEIRTPLNSVLGFTELLLETPLNNIQEQYVKNANTSGKALLEIINDILDFSKIEAGKLELDIIQTNIIQLMEEILEIVKYQANKKQIDLLFNVSKNLPDIAMVDSVRLKQIILNLLSNAIKFTHKGEVELKIKFAAIDNKRGILNFFVRDTGIGIKEEQKAKLFKAFSQTDSSTTRKFGGTGLGLIISNLLVEKMGGKIEVESEFGKGSVFKFSFETDYENCCKKENNNKKSLLTLENNFQTTKKLNIMIAEDLRANMVLLRIYVLKIIPNAIITEVVDGKEAIEKFKQQHPDLILMDVQMPEIDGLQATKLIREYEKELNIHIPVIAISAGVLNEQKDKCFQSGMDDFLAKPIRFEDIFNIIKKYLKLS